VGCDSSLNAHTVGVGGVFNVEGNARSLVSGAVALRAVPLPNLELSPLYEWTKMWTKLVRRETDETEDKVN
jgi:hypothetical protein